ncbi:MAG: anti-sigma factor [Actinobacteria bacterium]|nr:anti-sigma factor [Actinomycetota bacterium]MCB9413013.1 anti-sigma factor [Actinomycetota bacterium]
MTEMHEWVGAYAVDALDSEQREAFERHLAQCAACSEELEAYGEVLAALADTQAVAPPAEAWQAIEERIASTQDRSGRSAPSTPTADTPVVPSVGDRRRRPTLTWLAAAAAAAVLFTGGLVVGRETMPEVPTPADPSVASALEVAAAGDALFTEVDMMGARSKVVTSGEMDKSVFLAADLPTPAKGMCYQVWAVNEDGTKESAGVFVPDDQGHVAVVLDGGADVSSYVITLEPPGGSKSPTGEMVAQVGT